MRFYYVCWGKNDSHTKEEAPFPSSQKIRLERDFESKDILRIYTYIFNKACYTCQDRVNTCYSWTKDWQKGITAKFMFDCTRGAEPLRLLLLLFFTSLTSGFHLVIHGIQDKPLSASTLYLLPIKDCIIVKKTLWKTYGTRLDTRTHDHVPLLFSST